MLCWLIVYLRFYHYNKQTENRSKSNGEENVGSKVTNTMLRNQKRTTIFDIIDYTLKQKWRLAGHIARMKDNRWTKRCTE